MAKQLNRLQVSIDYTANTSKAEQNLKILKNTLTEIASINPVNLNANTGLQNAVSAAKDLQMHLNNAFNVNTGNLDLNKFNTSLARSNQNLSGLSLELLKAGNTGERAFLSLQSALTNTNLKLNQTKSLVGEMVNTIANSARWQIASSLLHAAIGQYQQAIGYAKSLNRALTDISIVTGQSASKMSEFADSANRAAKELRTTTTEYAKASLIYFQQGLSGEDVEERTAVTIKMANATGESADKVSQQLTAVWNNFYDGSKSLEYYADVMTALGAATASSTDEIAEGLEKFAAVSETVGLSYEYATSALATVTATTRQSADVVGTAFKTLFARIQDLELGNTLDDGTTLGKYSQALDAIGVDIKNANGGLKDMDSILDEMGTRWKILSEDQQVALAQQVAGVRQYTQLVALMDNWDFMKENLETAQNSTGTLAAQAAVYEKSWAAASDNVKTSLEGVYNELIPTDTIIDVTNAFADVLTAVDDIIDGMGGLKSILLLVSSIIVNKFEANLIRSLDAGIFKTQQLFTSIKATFTDSKNSIGQVYKTYKTNQKQNGFIAGIKSAGKEYDNQIKTKQHDQIQNGTDDLSKAQAQTINDALNSDIPLTEGFKDQLQSLQQINQFQNKIAINAKNLTTEEQKKLKIQLQSLEVLSEQKATIINQIEELKSLNEQQKWDLYDDIEVQQSRNIITTEGDITTINSDVDLNNEQLQDLNKINEEINKINNGLSIGEDHALTFNQTTTDLYSLQTGIFDLITNAVGISEQLVAINNDETLSNEKKVELLNQAVTKAQNEKSITENTAKALKQQINELTKGTLQGEKLNNAFRQTARSTRQMGQAIGLTEDSLSAAVANGQKLGAAFVKSSKLANQFNLAVNNIQKSLSAALSSSVSLSGTIVKLGSGLMSFSMAMSSISSVFDAFSEENASGIEKMSAIAMALTMTFRLMSGALEQVQKLMAAVNSEATIKNITDTIALAISKDKTSEEIKYAMAVAYSNAAENKEAQIAAVKEVLMANGITQTKALAAAKLFCNGATETNIDLTSVETAAQSVNNAVTNAGVIANLKYAASMLLAHPIILAVVAGLALLATVIGLTISVQKRHNKIQREAAENSLEQAKADQELIDKNQELSSSIQDLIDDYKGLKASGESTYDTLEKLKEQIPDLINSYQKLGKELNLDNEYFDKIIDLQNAYARAAIIGDFSEVQNLINEIDNKVKVVERSTQLNATKSANEVMARGEDVQGKVKGTKYSLKVGGHTDYGGESTANKIVSDNLGDYATQTNYKNGLKLTVDLTNANSMVDYYEKLVDARNQMESEMTDSELNSSGIYSEIKEEILALADGYEEAKTELDAYIETVKKAFNEEGFQNQDLNNITTLAEFENKKAEIIKAIQEQYDGITEEEAEAVLQSSDQFGHLFTASELLNKATQDSLNGITEESNKEVFEQQREKLQTYYDSLPEEEKTIFLALDFTDLNTEKKLTDAINDLKKKSELNKVDIEAEKLGLDIDTLTTYADILEDNNEALKGEEVIAKKVALANMRLNSGLEKLAESWKNNCDLLKEADRNSIEYAEALSEIRDAIEEAFGIHPSIEVIENNLDKIEQLAQGDTSSLNELQEALGRDYIAHIDYIVNSEGFNFSYEEIQNTLNQVLDDLTNNLNADLEIGANARLSQDYLDTLQAMLDNGQVTQDQLKRLFASQGYEFKVTGTKKVPGPTTTSYTTTSTWDADTGDWIVKSREKHENTEEIEVPIINGHVDSVETLASGSASSTLQAVKSTNASSINVKTLKDKSGSGGSQKDAKKLEDEIDRYHELTEAIEDTDRALNRLGKERQKSYGRNYLNYLDAEIKKTEELIDLNEQKIKQAQTNLLVDRGALMARASAAGTSVSFDELGRITNYDSMIAQAVGAYNGALTDEAEQAYSDFKNAISQYEETLNLLEDLGEQIQDYKDEILSKNYEKLTYELEVNITLNDNDLKILDYYINKCSDDFYKMGEAIAYTAKQSDSYIGKLEAQDNFLKKIEEDYKNGKISQADYVSGMQDSLDVIIENLEALNELDKTMKEYYGNTLEAAAQELSKYTDHLDALSEATEHLKKISELMGHDTAKELKPFYDAQVKQSENSLKVSTAHYNELVKRNQVIKDKWEKVKNDPNNKNYDYYKKQFEDVIKAEDKAYNKMLSDAENLAQALKDRLSNALQAAAKKMEKSMSGMYGNFDRLNDAIGHMKTLSEEYLTNTNKIYETNKLLRKIEQDTMKTTNTSAKAKYSAFAKEIEQLQQKDKLSAFELSIAQAKYKLLQAQIALEEAQNAKNDIRLSRDAEGNFGYVYTANADDISEAEQAVEDADNDLYNIRLNGANDYAQKVIQAQQDLQAKLAEIDEKYANDETARNEARAQAIDEYYELIKTYQDLYGIATDEDLRIREDAWSTHFEDLILNTENWKNAVNDYTQDSKNAFNDFDQGLQQVKGSVGNSLGDMISKTKELTNESSNLAKEIEEKVIPIIGDKLSEALNKTSEYAENQRSTIQGLISVYESLISSIQDAIRAQAELNNALASTPSTNVDGYTPSSGGGTGGGTGGGNKGKDTSSNGTQKDTTWKREQVGQFKDDGAIFKKLVSLGAQYEGGGYWHFQEYKRKDIYSAAGWPPGTYDTGGYTGEWGSEGKLAVLHEKEIVLNKEDTQNLLMTIDMVRQIANSIEEHALNWSLGTITSPTTDNSNNVLEQTVTITASFPNATQHSEIEEAFTTLINRASQYANRT